MDFNGNGEKIILASDGTINGMSRQYRGTLSASVH